jgi:1-hydroxycarotenoid 3,4-desaturase
MSKRAIVVGAGAGGLSCTIELAAAGWQVDVFEAHNEPGGKMHQRDVGGVGIDGGPTVFTMHWVFEELFKRGGRHLDDCVSLTESRRLARHAWTDGSHLDLFHDMDLSSDAIARFSDEENVEGYRRFCKHGEIIHDLLKDNFMACPQPSPAKLGYRLLRDGGKNALAVAPHQSLWKALSRYFSDPRLRQLYGRYATYVGSSPLLTPSTLMLIAHVERQGVWCVEGGMRALAHAMAEVALDNGANFHFNSPVEEITGDAHSVSGVRLKSGETYKADVVIFNGDSAALNDGLLGDRVRKAAAPRSRKDRGLSAITWCMRARTSGLDLDHHNVFFAENYEREFTSIFDHRGICAEPTVYVCAQDRVNGECKSTEDERLLVLVNAPADGDRNTWTPDTLRQQRDRAVDVIKRGGVNISVEEESCVATGPDDWHARFPASGGSLYGAASHGMFSSFTRASAKSRVRGLFLAGGSVHPGPGVPMATLSGSLAAREILGRAL